MSIDYLAENDRLRQENETLQKEKAAFAEAAFQAQERNRGLSNLLRRVLNTYDMLSGERQAYKKQAEELGV